MKLPRRLPGRLRWWHAYLVLLGLSFTVQLFHPAAPRPGPDRAVIEVPQQRASGPAGHGAARIAYRDTGRGPVVVYLHGSPGSSRDAIPLSRLLGERYRVIAPDLPGFGASSRWVADYGIEAHARYVLELMDRLDIRRVHLVGHSMGGGVALHVADLAPDRVLSITSYAGIGVQEWEGSGDYRFEHLKYAVGYTALVVAPELIPHFGLLGPRSLRHGFIRNFQDTDQRPLRGVLERLDVPFLIVHGRDDPLVPAEAAEEHHRIVEHSELAMLDAGHFLVFSDRGAAVLSAEILPFLQRSGPGAVAARRTVDRSSGVRRTVAVPDELRLDVARDVGPWWQAATLAVATFVSEDLTCIAAGLLARNGGIDLFVGIFGCLVGIFVGDLGLWAAGRLVGRRALGWGWVARRLPAARVDRFGERFDRHLGKAVVASRFLPGTRLPMYVAAGTVSRRPLAFAAWLLFAAALWTPILVVLAAAFGPVVARPFQALLGVGWLSLAAAALMMFMLVRTALLALTWKGRARLKARVSRLWRWEFWPLWLFYLPVVPWIAWLALRHRGLTVPTSANPALPHGGFVGESKHDILRRLPQSWIVPSLFSPAGPVGERVASLEREMAERGWSFPLILKPDEGQRGFGLRKAHRREDLESYFEAGAGDVLVQTFDPGPHEAGIFYYRIPGEQRGRIFSITHKRFPEVTGDGRHTLEELILRDRRLRMQAATFLRRHAERLEEIPGEGRRVRLAVAGNHCQGTMFLDGSHLITPELERSVGAVAKEFQGFWFGRFDVRYTDVEQFKAGRDFRIVELNGVTSESTNIYDPAWSLLTAYRTLYRQWSLAFRIGAANRRDGHAPSSLPALFKAAREHYRDRPSLELAD